MNTQDRITATTTDTSRCGLNRMTGRLATVAAFAAVALLTAAARADDPYIESTSRSSTGGISTGYRMNGDSRVEVDFSLTSTESCTQWRIFGDDVRDSSLRTYMYIDGDGHYTLIVSPNGFSRYTTYLADTLRHTAIFDLYHPGLYFVTDGVTNWAATSETSFAGRVADLPLSLFARYSNTTATRFEAGAKARIYGVKIYERDILVHDFVPCLRDGETPCFKDLVGGGFIIGEDVSKFTAGGDVPTYPDNAYVSTAANANGGKFYISTEYKASAKTAVAIDCALTVNTNLVDSYWILFDCNGGVRFNMNFNHWSGLRFSAGGTSDMTTLADTFPPPVDDKDVRRTFFLDNLNTKAAVITSGFTNKTATFSVSNPSVADGTAILLASDPWATGCYSALKIYGCKIWEDGVLVRDFMPWLENGTPGLRDVKTGTFCPGKEKGGSSPIAYGGTITGERDAYIQSAGTANISTGHKMNGSSRVEVDFALSEASDYKQWRVFGTDTDTSFKTWLYIDGDSHYSMVCPWGQKWTTHTADTIRHTAIIDVNHGWAGLVTGTTTNWSSTTTTSYAGQEAEKALPLFGRNYAFAKERIYSVRIYESDVLVHEFLPYSRGGVVGFYDTETGGIISNGSSFTFGGMGQDHGQLKAYIKPGYGTEVTYGKTVTLTAYAPGATSYRWLMDGEPVAGGTDGVFTVDWARGGVRAEGGYRHEYQAIAVFDDFYGVTRESAPSAPATVTSLPRALTIIVK